MINQEEHDTLIQVPKPAKSPQELKGEEFEAIVENARRKSELLRALTQMIDSKLAEAAKMELSGVYIQAIRLKEWAGDAWTLLFLPINSTGAHGQTTPLLNTLMNVYQQAGFEVKYDRWSSHDPWVEHCLIISFDKGFQLVP